MTTITLVPRLYDPLEEMRKLRYIREAKTGQNHGRRINGIQIWAGGSDGDSYCCEAWWLVHDVAYQGAFYLPPEQACAEVYAFFAAQDWLVDEPAIGDTYFFVDEAGHAHHIGLVTDVAPLSGISGNTSEDGRSSNGDGFHEHELLVPRDRIRFGRIPR